MKGSPIVDQQAEAVRIVDKAVASTLALLAVRDDPLLQSFLVELRRYRSLVLSHWPLSVDEKAGVDIGRVAVRELDGTWPDYVSQLSRLGAFLRADGEVTAKDSP